MEHFMVTTLSDQIYFQTDDAWDLLPAELAQGLQRRDVREEARGLRFITSPRRLEAFAQGHEAQFRPYTLYGSGDFHHLSAVWTRQFRQNFSIVSFDNHPDWDIRPPRWSCGAWVNRALENPLVQSLSVWGCGNFECSFPGRLLGNRRAALTGRLQVHPWTRGKQAYPAWLSPIRPESWRESFTSWLSAKRGQRLYVTIDLDCLAEGAISTNWEPGKYNCDDIVWALGQIRDETELIGGDLCGAWSKPLYATRFQKLAGGFDHPKLPDPTPAQRAAGQAEVFSRLWPALTGADLVST
jgi:hypothetical protein